MSHPASFDEFGRLPPPAVRGRPQPVNTRGGAHVVRNPGGPGGAAPRPNFGVAGNNMAVNRGGAPAAGRGRNSAVRAGSTRANPVTVDPEMIELEPDTSAPLAQPNSLHGRGAPVIPDDRADEWDALEDVEVLGQGGQGVVWKCKSKRSGETYVAKEMRFPPTNDATFRAALEHARMIERLSHTHLIKYLAVRPTRESTSLTLRIIMKHYTEKDLTTYLAMREEPITEFQICSMVLQITQALDYLHQQSPPIVHRDVKPDNILLFNQGEQILLMDLDASRCVGTQMGSQSNTETQTTLEYMSPEAMRGIVNKESDVWSLGVVAFMCMSLFDSPMLTHNGEMTVLGFQGWTPEELDSEIEIAIANNRGANYSDNLKRLVKNMLHPNPDKRPSAFGVSVRLTELMEDALLAGAM